MKNWSPAISIKKIMFALQSLLRKPNVDDPLHPEIAELYKTNRVEQDRIARGNVYIHHC